MFCRMMKGKLVPLPMRVPSRFMWMRSSTTFPASSRKTEKRLGHREAAVLGQVVRAVKEHPDLLAAWYLRRRFGQSPVLP
jgi:hypothetical protein